MIPSYSHNTAQLNVTADARLSFLYPLINAIRQRDNSRHVLSIRSIGTHSAPAIAMRHSLTKTTASIYLTKNFEQDQILIVISPMCDVDPSTFLIPSVGNPRTSLRVDNRPSSIEQMAEFIVDELTMDTIYSLDYHKRVSLTIDPKKAVAYKLFLGGRIRSLQKAHDFYEDYDVGFLRNVNLIGEDPNDPSQTVEVLVETMKMRLHPDKFKENDELHPEFFAVGDFRDGRALMVYNISKTAYNTYYQNV